ncbi:hypothetical protein XA26_26270 [Mycolicibacterium fortuitum]|uniref:Uncharacterized protein n=1 Tax=Mycolicibacterium fortuitum TaxID=1766 RepID=A0A0N9XFM6_MYCFO|nr:hypothetical protein G155_00128 [Mycobacterium sp. VKM Ac-1817D]ALI26470.1 hypothetical protein XA26_26270 [Mycolicibacterium fortuitum]
MWIAGRRDRDHRGDPAGAGNGAGRSGPGSRLRCGPGGRLRGGSAWLTGCHIRSSYSARLPAHLPRDAAPDAVALSAIEAGRAVPCPRLEAQCPDKLG